MELVYVELDPGDVLFFHCNTLHRSDQNKSPNPRWSMICCYNTKHNNPYKASHHPFYEKLEKVSDSALKGNGREIVFREDGVLGAEHRQDGRGGETLELGL